jgi:hypothetical protein
VEPDFDVDDYDNFEEDEEDEEADVGAEIHDESSGYVEAEDKTQDEGRSFPIIPLVFAVAAIFGIRSISSSL